MYNLSETDAKLYKQRVYEQHRRGDFYLDSLVNPGTTRRYYRVLVKKQPEQWFVLHQYKHLKNAVSRIHG